MTYEECETLVESYKSAVMLSNSGDLKEEDRNEAQAIRDALGDFIAGILFYYLEEK